jgi:hypothetical protein
VEGDAAGKGIVVSPFRPYLLRDVIGWFEVVHAGEIRWTSPIWDGLVHSCDIGESLVGFGALGHVATSGREKAMVRYSAVANMSIEAEVVQAPPPEWWALASSARATVDWRERAVAIVADPMLLRAKWGDCVADPGFWLTCSRVSRIGQTDKKD